MSKQAFGYSNNITFALPLSISGIVAPTGAEIVIQHRCGISGKETHHLNVKKRLKKRKYK